MWLKIYDICTIEQLYKCERVEYAWKTVLSRQMLESYNEQQHCFILKPDGNANLILLKYVFDMDVPELQDEFITKLAGEYETEKEVKNTKSR